MTPSIAQIAQTHSLSEEVVTHLFNQLSLGHGKQAQFNHPALGGMGQWQNGMLMVSDFSNHALKAKLTGVFADLVRLYTRQGAPEAIGTRPETDNPGKPSMVATQNHLTVNYYQDKALLVITDNQRRTATTYSVAPHRLTGVSQQNQNNSVYSLSFSNDKGQNLTVEDFKQVS
ncbi:hypothetical protein [Arsenicibacter rosenii]|uniref:Uncharacterized protein n=1 Tax=Arsenicibacter rosenii TaxID=1750698 RepID=A0A1S2VND9_9BACT|nr:hypothetical protein [Arsenicibacter rosenii]OIN60264.1 hypothetical protein BLX24_05380 [Arsenicibacter rosenii]